MADDDLLRAMMRSRTKSGARGRSLAERQSSLATRANAAFQPTVGGGATQSSIAGRSMTIPQQQNINWGGIIDRGVGRYQEAKGEKELEQVENEQVDAEFDIAEEIYNSTLRDDPEGAKLIRMAQMGIPGADKALADHLTPKTQSLAVLVQAVTTGKLDPDMAAELAPQFGVSPEMARKGAAYARQQLQEAEEQDFRQKAALRMMGRGGAGGAGSGKLSFEEYQNLTPEEQDAYDRFSGRRGAKDDGMTPGQSQVAAKEIVASDKNIREGQINISKGESLRKFMEDPKTFGGTQKLAQVMANSNVPMLGGLVAGAGTAMRSEGVALLESYVNSEVLDRMAQLGGNDSNEELRQMRQVLPSALNNQKTAKALYEQVLAFQKRKLQEEKEFQKGLRSGEFFKPQTPTAAPAPATPPAGGQIEILEFLPE